MEDKILKNLKKKNREYEYHSLKIMIVENIYQEPTNKDLYAIKFREENIEKLVPLSYIQTYNIEVKKSYYVLKNGVSDFGGVFFDIKTGKFLFSL